MTRIYKFGNHVDSGTNILKMPVCDIKVVNKKQYNYFISYCAFDGHKNHFVNEVLPPRDSKINDYIAIRELEISIKNQIRYRRVTILSFQLIGE